jgi:DNA-binding transcriptional ArsR family regulator
MSIADTSLPASAEADDPVFRALASALRRQILDALRDGPQTTGALCAAFPALDRCTVMQHLSVLEAAGLVIAERRGRERWNHLNALPIRRIQDRWIAPHAARAVDRLMRLEDGLAGGG